MEVSHPQPGPRGFSGGMDLNLTFSRSAATFPPPEKVTVEPVQQSSRRIFTAPVLSGGSPISEGGRALPSGGTPTLDGGSPIPPGGAGVLSGGTPISPSGAPILPGGSPISSGGSPICAGGTPVSRKSFVSAVFHALFPVSPPPVVKFRRPAAPVLL
jgi:hypothetical protein